MIWKILLWPPLLLLSMLWPPPAQSATVYYSLWRWVLASLGCTHKKLSRRGVDKMNRHCVHREWWSVPDFVTVTPMYPLLPDFPGIDLEIIISRSCIKQNKLCEQSKMLRPARYVRTYVRTYVCIASMYYHFLANISFGVAGGVAGERVAGGVWPSLEQ